ncbi:MAG: DUF559 domain-containing protein [Pseudomonadota bacterium]
MPKKWSAEQRQILSERLKETRTWNIRPGWNKGIPRTEEQKKHHSEVMKGRPSTFKGQHHTAEANEKNRLAHLGRVPWNKGLKGAQIAWNKGQPWPEEARRRMSEGSKGCYHTEETARRIAATMKVIRNQPEVKCQLRRQILERIERQLDEGGQVFPFYNRRACDWFRRFDETNQTQGQYATNGGEYQIAELGYFLDYINHEKRLIIEWDEEYHYRNGQLREKDVRRQKEIEEQFPEYTFIRIRESEEIPAAALLLSG